MTYTIYCGIWTLDQRTLRYRRVKQSFLLTAMADWSLTPGRYVGVAPPEEDEDFDFELADLNKEATELAARIQENFEELGV